MPELQRLLKVGACSKALIGGHHACNRCWHVFSVCCAAAGIVTSALAGLLGQARLYVVLGRERLLPPCLAAIHAGRATPVNATAFSAITAGGFPPPFPKLADVIIASAVVLQGICEFGFLTCDLPYSLHEVCKALQ